MTPFTPLRSRTPLASDAPGGTSGLAALLVRGIPGVPGWSVRRAWPADLRDPGAGYALELVSTGTHAPAGLLLGAICTEEGVRLVEVDDRLPGLAPRVAAGYTLVGHRPGKRAVLRTPEGTFVKLARPRATHRALEALAAVDRRLSGVPDAPALPHVLAGSTVTGVLELAPAAGRDLGAVLSSATPHEAARRAGDVTRMLVALARAGAPAGSHDLPLHTLTDEAEVLERWSGAALAQAPLTDGESIALTHETPRITARLRELAGNALTAESLALTHRDLHEGQILVGASHGPRLTVLDWDTASLAHPATDVANLLSHVTRLARLGAVPAPVAAQFRERVLTRLGAAGHPATTPDGLAVLALLEEATALRLVAVHAFRPRA